MPTVLFPRPGQNTLPFPVEIVDYIIDFLHKDKNSLSSCALVSRAFVASSQYHLFCMLLFRWKEGLDFAYVVPFFQERTHLKRYVKEVYIVKGSTLGSKLASVICLNDIAGILSTFPSLCTFAIDTVEFSDSTLHTKPYSLTKIECLNLMNIGYYGSTSHKIIGLLGLFSKIQSLHIEDVWIHKIGNKTIEQTIDEGVAKLPSQQGPSLTQLTLMGDDRGMFTPSAYLLTTCNMLRDLEELRIVCWEWSDFESACAIIQSSSNTLARLVLDVAHIIMGEVVVEHEQELLDLPLDIGRWKQLLLSSCHSLRYFETSVLLIDLDNEELAWFPTMRPTVFGFQYMLDLLSEVPQCIEELTIFLRLHDQGQSCIDMVSQDYDWDRLVAAIYSFRLIKVVNIIILVAEKFSVDEAYQCQKIIVAALHPKLQEQRETVIIRVSYEVGKYDEIVRDGLQTMLFM